MNNDTIYFLVFIDKETKVVTIGRIHSQRETVVEFAKKSIQDKIWIVVELNENTPEVLYTWLTLNDVQNAAEVIRGIGEAVRNQVLKLSSGDAFGLLW